MTARSKYRGNDIIFDNVNNEWIFEKTKQSVVETHEEVPCGYCGKVSTPEGHDACLGTLIGVMNACCGHGNNKEAYIQFWDGECIRGDDALIIINILRKYS